MLYAICILVMNACSLVTFFNSDLLVFVYLGVRIWTTLWKVFCQNGSLLGYSDWKESLGSPHVRSFRRSASKISLVCTNISFVFVFAVETFLFDPTGTRRSILCGTGRISNAEWGRTGDVTPSSTPPCLESHWWCCTLP